MFRRVRPWLVSFTPIYMPALSPSMEKGKLIEWNVKPGDKIEIGTVWCKLETDKAAVEFNNTSEEGYLAKIFRQAGETVNVTETIAVIVDEEADVGKGDEYVVQDAPATEPEPVVPASTPSPSSKPSSSSSSSTKKKAYYGGSIDEALKASGPGVMRVANSMKRDSLDTVVPTGKNGRFTKEDLSKLSKSGEAIEYESSKSAKEVFSKSDADVASVQGTTTVSSQQSPMVSVIVSPQPVYNLKYRDNAVLSKLLGKKKKPPTSMPKKEETTTV